MLDRIHFTNSPPLLTSRTLVHIISSRRRIISLRMEWSKQVLPRMQILTRGKFLNSIRLHYVTIGQSIAEAIRGKSAPVDTFHCSRAKTQFAFLISISRLRGLALLKAAAESHLLPIDVRVSVTARRSQRSRILYLHSPEMSSNL